MNNKKELYEDISDDELFCDVCGLTYKEFLETGEYRCDNCLNVFKPRIIKLLKNKIEEDINKKNIVVTTKEHTIKKSINDVEDIKVRIKELEKLLKLCKSFHEDDKVEIIEAELKKLKERVEIEK